MANNKPVADTETVSAWVKRCFFAARALMEDALRPHGIGATQWYVLHQLATEGPTMQRELGRMLQIERATVSIVVSALVRKGLVEQVQDATDQRQKLLRLTPAGSALWDELPDLRFIQGAAFEGFSNDEIATVIRVLEAATERLVHRSKGPTT